MDTLLEDWYPDLGARFVQNSRGMYLITRIVPCNKCLLVQKETQDTAAKSRDAWAMVDLSPSNKLDFIACFPISNLEICNLLRILLPPPTIVGKIMFLYTLSFLCIDLVKLICGLQLDPYNI